MRRRHFLSLAPAISMRAQTARRPHIQSIAVISRQPGQYHGWPTVASRNGELLLVYSGGREAHTCPFGRVEVMRSRDGGATWTWPEVLFDSPIDDRDAGILASPSGALLVTTFTSLAFENILKNAAGWDSERLERWQAANRRATAEQRQGLLDTWMLRSGDGGMTWSAAYRVPVNSPHGPVAVAGGRLLYAGKELWKPARRVGVCESRDDGRSWRWLSDIRPRPGDSWTQYHELHAVEAANGRILAHIRNQNPRNEGETLQAESDDGGESWTTPHPIGVWGLPSHLLRLRDGRLLMSYGHRREPFGNQARISADHGATWSEPIVISGDGASGDLGYPSTVELEEGRLLTIWYELLEGSAHAALRQARWSI